MDSQANYSQDVVLLEQLIEVMGTHDPARWRWVNILREFKPESVLDIRHMRPSDGHLVPTLRRELLHELAIRGLGVDWADVLTRAGIVRVRGALLARADLWRAIKPHVPEGIGRNTAYRALEGKDLRIRWVSPGPCAFFEDLALEKVPTT